jgi:hypothetical protein
MTKSFPRLRVVGSPGELAPSRLPPAPEPRPFVYRMTEHRHPDGRPYTDTLCVWANEEGLRCRLCRPGDCTFTPGSEGIGTCVFRRDGGLAGPVPLPLR